MDPLHVIAAAAGETFGIGVIVSAFLFGFRHGIDWDHIAAITDIAGSQDDRRSAMFFGTLYAVGHALVVFLIGTAAILLGERLPASVDNVMEKIVGVTLILLGVFVFVSLARHGREFRLRSRWMLIFSGVRNAYRRIGGSTRGSARSSNRSTGTLRKAATPEPGSLAVDDRRRHPGLGLASRPSRSPRSSPPQAPGARRRVHELRPGNGVRRRDGARGRCRDADADRHLPRSRWCRRKGGRRGRPHRVHRGTPDRRIR